MHWQFLLLAPVAGGCVYWAGTTACMAWFFRPRAARTRAPSSWPSVSLIKPLCGDEKFLEENLRSACRQDYPDYEVIFPLHSDSDPALETARRVAAEFPDKARVVADEATAGPNGRLTNILNGSRRSRGEVLVFSDSDMFLEPSYLREIVAPLSDPAVGVACTVYKAWKAESVPEKLELLSLNADFIPSLVFATVTGASTACPGASQAVRRDVLERCGGLAPLAHYLVEDLEMGRRISGNGLQVRILPHVAATAVGIKDARAWWRHQVYWDQNTRVASPVGFFFTLLVRGVPFALLYAACGGPRGLSVAAAALGVRMLTALVNSACFLQDAEGVRDLWLLPLRDVAGLFVWVASFVQRKVFWKGRTFVLRDNLLVEAR